MKPEVHYRARKSPPLVPVLSQRDATHILRVYSFKIHFNIVLPFTPWSSKWPLLFTLPFILRISHHSNAFYVSHPYHPPWSGDPVVFGEVCKSLIQDSCLMRCNAVYPDIHFLTFRKGSLLWIIRHMASVSDTTYRPMARWVVTDELERV
jgi:hypothetical protein